jgi:hypothetical protein
MDLSPLKTSLRTKLGFTPLQETGGSKQIRLLGRIPLSRMGDVLIFVHHIHNEWLDRKKPGWTADISKLYFLHPQTKKVVFGWRLIFGGDDIAKHLPDIVNAVASTPGSSRVEVMEVPLVGASPDRNAHVRGKGAGFTDKTPTGPLAARALQGRG